ncbi:uncharacterized protein LOC110659633 isoform X3 [Hevea brasiliensis]|uniref:uncharacterized protein LOC110659633 isoform X3 n=1 Tax=Hevea brasiliensis TaxID=3981 RepID=UPI0025FDA332|nr:uncharacterized protein LOC110659633 isoform X3 [Hevea brasiliensis]
MAFWGTEVKAGKPFTLKPDDARGRLHISQATLGIGTGTKKSVVQCNVGKRSPVFLCSLFPEQSESCQLNLEFEEADEVVFSVIGPISVHLTGYYLGGSRLYNPDDASESYGEDIADTETERSTDGSDEGEYEDSFIDDADPEVIPSSPVSIDGVGEEMLHKRKLKNEKAKNRRLRKKYLPCQSDDDYTSQQHTFANGGTSMPALYSETDDRMTISSFYKSAERNKSPEASEKAEKERGQKINEMKDDGNYATMAERKANAVVDSELKRQPDQHESILPSAHVGSENGVKPKKKRKKQSKEEKQLITGIEDDFFFGTILKWDKAQQNETKADKSSQDIAVTNEEDQRTKNDKGDIMLHFSPPSFELDHGIPAESGKKKKKQAKEEKGLEAGSPFHANVNEDDKAKGENIEQHILLENDENQKKENDEGILLPSIQLVHGIAAKSSKKKNKQAKEEKGLQAENPSYGNVNRDDKTQPNEAKGENIEQEVFLKNEENQKKENDEGISPPCIELVHGIAAKFSKKKKKHAKEEKGLQAEIPFYGIVHRDDKTLPDEAKGENIEQDVLLKNEEHEKQENDESKAVLRGNSQLPSTQVGPENGLKPKRKRKDKTLEVDSGKDTNVIKEDQSSQEELKSNHIECDGSLQNKENQSSVQNLLSDVYRVFDNNQSANENHSRKRKKKRKGRTLDDGEALNMDKAKDRSVMDIDGNNGDEKQSQLRSPFQMD